MNPSVTNPTAVTLGAALRRIRRDEDITQLALAQAAGVNRSAVSQIEKGMFPPKLYTMLAFADACGYDVTVSFARRDA